MSAAIKRGDVNRALRSAGAQFAVIEKSCGKRRCVTAGLDTTQVADSVRVDFQVSSFDQTLLSVQSLVAAKEILEAAGFAVEVHTMMFALADRIIDAPDQNRPSAADAAEWRVDHSAIVETGFGCSWGAEIAHWLTVRAAENPAGVEVIIGKYQWIVESTDPVWGDWRDAGHNEVVDGKYQRITYKSRSWNCRLLKGKDVGGVTLHQRDDGSVHTSNGWGRLSAARIEDISAALTVALGFEVLS